MKSQPYSATQALTVSTQTFLMSKNANGAFDLTNCSGASTTITCPASASGSIFYEWCNNTAATADADWKAVPVAQYPNATATLVASQSVTINVHGLHVAALRVRVTLAAGAGNYTAYTLGKNF